MFAVKSVIAMVIISFLPAFLIVKLLSLFLLINEPAMAESVPAVNWLKAPSFGKAYHLANEKMPLERAKWYCASLGGRLLLTQSKEENAFIHSSFNQLNSIWLDLQKDASGRYKRSDGSSVAYANWSASDKRDANGFIQIKSGLWHSYDKPLDVASVICEQDIHQDSQLAEKVATIESRLDSMNTCIESLEAKFNRLEAKFDRLEAKFDRSEAKFDRMMTLMSDTAAKVNAMSLQIKEIAETQNKTNVDELFFETLDK